MSRLLKVGDKAPDFTLPDTNLKQRSLNEFLVGKTVLAFFVGAFTSVCTKEMCTFRDSMARLIDLEAQIVGFPILSDYKREVIKAYGIELPHFAGLIDYMTAKRAIFILDTGGVVRYRWVTNDPADEPKYSEIEEFLAKMK